MFASITTQFTFSLLFMSFFSTNATIISSAALVVKYFSGKPSIACFRLQVSNTNVLLLCYFFFFLVC